MTPIVTSGSPNRALVDATTSQVAAGAEEFLRPSEYADPQLGIVVELVQRGVECIGERPVDRVALRRAHHPDNEHVTRALDVDQGSTVRIRHRRTISTPTSVESP
jgi:hypothetical protein